MFIRVENLQRLYYITLPHDVDLRFLVDDNVELEPGSDGQRKAELWQNVNIELVLLLLRLQTLHSTQVMLISLELNIQCSVKCQICLGFSDPSK